MVNVELLFRFHTRSVPVKYAGCDLHKQSITVCVVNLSREVQIRRRFLCADEASIRRFFAELGAFEAGCPPPPVGWQSQTRSP